MKTFLSRIKNWADDVLAYVLTFLGSVLGTSYELFKAGNDVEFKMNWVKLLVAAFVALLITLGQEFIPIPENPVEDKTKAGRAKHFKRRMFFAALFGLASTKIVDMFFKLLGL